MNCPTCTREMTVLFNVSWFCKHCENRKTPPVVAPTANIPPITPGHCGKCGLHCEQALYVRPTFFGIVSHYTCNCGNSWVDVS